MCITLLMDRDHWWRSRREESDPPEVHHGWTAWLWAWCLLMEKQKRRAHWCSKAVWTCWELRRHELLAILVLERKKQVISEIKLWKCLTKLCAFTSNLASANMEITVGKGIIQPNVKRKNVMQQNVKYPLLEQCKALIWFSFALA